MLLPMIIYKKEKNMDQTEQRKTSDNCPYRRWIEPAEFSMTTAGWGCHISGAHCIPDKRCLDVKEDDGRYPYTYAADLVRSWAGYDKGGMKLSRSDASKIRHKIADILDIDDEKLANKLADYRLANQELIDSESMKEFLTIVLDEDVSTFTDEAKKVLGISPNSSFAVKKER